jgi:hypothetical protein
MIESVSLFRDHNIGVLICKEHQLVHAFDAIRYDFERDREDGVCARKFPDVNRQVYCRSYSIVLEMDERLKTVVSVHILFPVENREVVFNECEFRIVKIWSHTGEHYWHALPNEYVETTQEVITKIGKACLKWLADVIQDKFHYEFHCGYSNNGFAHAMDHLL